jgi:nucleoside-diphosphate-sugar epimerase
MNTAETMPSTITNVEELETALSAPPAYLIEMMGRLRGDLMIVGVAGKMGPSLAHMAQRASDMAGVKRRIIGVARFSKPEEQAKLRAWGIETIRCDLLDPAALDQLPDVANIIYMAGMKFGSSGNLALTWAMNTLLPAMVCRKYGRSRIVAFSTGNVYGLTPVARGGSREADPPQPQGEYAMSCLGRERTFEYFSNTASMAVTLIRLNYACELRYGVLVDMARKVLADEPIDLTMGNFNVIWQGDANAMALASLEHAGRPGFVLNVAGPELLSVRNISERLGQLLEHPVKFTGAEAPDALLSNGQLSHHLYGYPRVSVECLLEWVAKWVKRGGESLNKPTHFETRSGQF